MVRKVFLVCWLWWVLVGFIHADDDLNLVPITAENADQLQLIGRFGRGVATSLDWHPDGERLAVGSASGLWLLDETLQILTPTPIQNVITRVAWSPDGLWLAVISDQMGKCSIQVWSSDFSEQVFSQSDCVQRLAWSPDSAYLALSPYLGETLLLTVATRETVIVRGGFVGWSNENPLLFTSSRDENIRTYYQWDAKNAEMLSQTEHAYNRNHYQVLWVVDDQTLAFRCDEVVETPFSAKIGVCYINLLTGDVVWTHTVLFYEVDGYETISLNGASLRDDGAFFAWRDYSHYPFGLNYINGFDLQTGELKAWQWYGNAFDWKPNSDDFTVIVGNGMIRTYGDNPAESQFFNAPINMIAIRPDHQQVASTGYGYQQDTLIWDMSHSWDEPLRQIRSEPAGLVDYTADGKELVLGGLIITDIFIEQRIDGFDADTGEYNRTITAYSGEENRYQHVWNGDYTEALILPENIEKEEKTYTYWSAPSWSPDGSKFVMVQNFHMDNNFFLYTFDGVTGQFITLFEGGLFYLSDFIWSPDSGQIAVLMARYSAGSGHHERVLSVFDVVQGQNSYGFGAGNNQFETGVVVTEEDSSLQPIRATWSPDSTMLAMIIPDVIVVYSLGNEETPFISLPVPKMRGISWSDDGRLIMGAGEDGMIYVWGVMEEEFINLIDD